MRRHLNETSTHELIHVALMTSFVLGALPVQYALAKRGKEAHFLFGKILCAAFAAAVCHAFWAMPAGHMSMHSVGAVIIILLVLVQFLLTMADDPRSRWMHRTLGCLLVGYLFPFQFVSGVHEFVRGDVYSFWLLLIESGTLLSVAYVFKRAESIGEAEARFECRCISVASAIVICVHFLTDQPESLKEDRLFVAILSFLSAGAGLVSARISSYSLSSCWLAVGGVLCARSTGQVGLQRVLLLLMSLGAAVASILRKTGNGKEYGGLLLSLAIASVFFYGGEFWESMPVSDSIVIGIQLEVTCLCAYCLVVGSESLAMTFVKEMNDEENV